ncbi:alkyl hydroperoxide reductase [Elizabethkingia meningoseptica]|uniref:alkyl hydroperoxide reductase n=1 Tax=Elizabethkingia meningoseptica TaxID=238 RepID=UPI0021A845D5|nr:alkyl hydroperoxide reductase [Elizabethkingia meningoseptica]
MKEKVLIILFCTVSIVYFKAQQISMNFPQFSGKNYDFVIFNGSQQKTVFQGIIPSDGKFELSIPKQYTPYVGMSRWLITGTKEGGGLDMFIPGHDFSVSCLHAKPDERNIIYTNNTGNTELSSLYKKQEGILSRYHSMFMATKSYDGSDAYYNLFKSELEKQKKDYTLLQEDLRRKTDYISRFFLIVNISRGMGNILTGQEDERARDISQYISQKIDWKSLYTSGYWSAIIESWVDIHLKVIKDSKVFVEELNMIVKRMEAGDLYTDFVERLFYYLKQDGGEDYLSLMSTMPISSDDFIDCQ